MLTCEFPHYKAPFFQFNPAQSAVVPFLCEDCNLVVSFPTASGKTILAECCFGFHLAGEGRVAYVAPFRSLAREKFEAWSEDGQLNQHGVALCAGDSPLDAHTLAASRLVVFTLESFDSKLRRGPLRGWFEELVCVCFDEAQIVGTERGPTMEVALMSVSEMAPNARFVLLSGTMGNAKKLASWVKSLNAKPTKCCVSSWRQNPLEVFVHGTEDFSEQIDKVLELCSAGGKTVVFVHSKATGRKIAKRLIAAGRMTAFHNASLSAKKKRDIERRFSEPFSGLNVLVSTSTLGAGVNIG